jgi:hypothetical protein
MNATNFIILSSFCILCAYVLGFNMGTVSGARKMKNHIERLLDKHLQPK